MNTLNILFFTIATTFIATAQVPKKRLPQNINVPTYSHIFPSLSGDGNKMIFLTNYTNSEGFETKYSYKIGAEIWADPEPIPNINRPSLDHIGSFCLSYDGNFVVFSSRRSPGIGNYDIWISERSGNSWSQPKNPGKPLNSATHEGNPSLSPDGKSMYFMRCESMDNTNKRNCKLFVSHRISSTRWSEPTALPNYINAGHETTPRIMVDNKSLVFASGRPGGKGMLDLYMTTNENNTWSKPQPLSYINTDQNDEFVSIPARGDIIYFSGTYRDQYNVYKAIIPKEFRAQKVLMLTGKVAYDDGQKPSEDILIQAFDIASGEIYTTTKLNKSDDSYAIFLPEGASYDVSAFPQKGGHSYQAKIYDLTNMPISRKEELPISLSAITTGSTMPLNTIRYEDYSAVLTHASDIEIKRIAGFLKKNPGIRIEIAAFIDQVNTDSIQTNDLTEIIADTLFFEIEKEEILLDDNLVKIDSVKDEIDESSFEKDTFEINNNELTFLDSNEIDTKEFALLDSSEINEFEIEPEISSRDSIVVVGYELLEETDDIEIFIKINYTYHNDRTQQQAEALMNKLIDTGVPANLLEAKGYGDDWEEDLATEERNYWIELKILSN